MGLAFNKSIKTSYLLAQILQGNKQQK